MPLDQSSLFPSVTQDQIDYNVALSAAELSRAAEAKGITLRSTLRDPKWIPQSIQWIENEFYTRFQGLLNEGWVKRIHARMLQFKNEIPMYFPPIFGEEGGDQILLVGGPAGGGKSRIAESLMLRLVDGDELHTDEAVQTMHGGGTLKNEYRETVWLPRFESVVQELREFDAHSPVIIVCSALTASVRQELIHRFCAHHRIFAHAPRDVLKQRLASRAHAFIPPDAPDFLDDQVQLWGQTEKEVRTCPEWTLIVDTAKPQEQVDAAIRNWLGSKWARNAAA